MPRKRAPLIFVLILSIAGCTSQVRLPELTPAQLTQKHMAAVGGSAVNQLQSWTTKSRVSANNQTLGYINTVIQRPNHILVSSHLGKSDSVLMFDGHNGWTRGNTGVTPMDKNEVARLRVRGYLDELLACQAESCTMALTGQGTVDSIPCYILTLTWKDSSETIVFLRSTDFLIAKVGSSIEYKHRSIPLDTFFSDYHRVGGVLVPFEMRVAGSYGSYTISMESFEPNITIAKSVFSVEKIKEQ